MSALLQFMYTGEVSVAEDMLKDFMRTAETLQIKGLLEEQEQDEDEEEDVEEQERRRSRKIAVRNTTLLAKYFNNK